MKGSVARTLLLVAGVAALGGWVALRERAPSPEDCTEVPTFAGREKCLRGILVTTTRDSGPVAAARQLDGILREYPSLTDVCHQPSHAVATNSTTPGEEEMIDYLDSEELRVCDWGIIHGLLDRYADAGTLEDVVVLLGHCATLDDPGDRSGCGDSVGHALYETVGEFSGAAEACTLHPKVLDACVSGVFMQFFSPVAPSDKGDQLGSAVPVDSLPELCRSVGGDVRTSCQRATYYAYSQILGPVRYRMSKSDRPGNVFFDEFLPVYRQGVAFCESHGGPGGAGCTEDLNRMTLQLLLPFDDPVLLEAVCDAAPRDSKAFCRTVAANLRTTSD